MKVPDNPRRAPQTRRPRDRGEARGGGLGQQDQPPGHGGSREPLPPLACHRFEAGAAVLKEQLQLTSV